MRASCVIAPILLLISWTICSDSKVKALSSSVTESVLVWFNHTLELKCHVGEEDYDRIVWKKGEDDLLAVGSVVFSSDPRVHVTKLGTLRLEKTREDDAGNYQCQSGGRTSESEKQIFQVAVEEFKCLQLTAPNNGQISFHHANDQNPFTNDSIATYTCDSGFTLTGTPTRRCLESYDNSDGWDGEQPICLPEELRILEDRLIQLEKHILLSEQRVAPRVTEQQQSPPAPDNNNNNGDIILVKARLQNVENETAILLRKQAQLRDWTSREIQILRSSIHQTTTGLNLVNVSNLDQVTHQLNNMWARVQLLHDQLQTRVDKVEKTISDNLQSPRSPSSTTLVTNRLTELSSIVSERLGALENETRALSQTFHKQLRLLEHVDSVNAIGNAWEETQKQSVARCRVSEGGKLFWEYIWIVHSIEAKQKKSLEKGAGHFSTQSNAFYTGIPGYRLRLVLYPNFDGSGQLALFSGLLPGEFDEQVSWPFNYDYHLAVVSHDPDSVRDHVGVIVMPPTTCDLSNFQRPRKGDPPSACGFRHFMSHKMLSDKSAAYIASGHLWVRIRIFI